jgi:hypothetical protein
VAAAFWLAAWPLPAAAHGVLTDDAFTTAALPNFNHGRLQTVVIKSGSRGFLKFGLGTLPDGVAGGDVARATLRVWVGNVFKAGALEVYRVDGAWAESALTDATAPSLGALEATVRGRWPWPHQLLRRHERRFEGGPLQQYRVRGRDDHDARRRGRRGGTRRSRPGAMALASSATSMTRTAI